MNSLQKQVPTASGQYRRWLCGQIEERRRRVPSYSMRSFASKIGVSPTSLSQIISGKRPLTHRMALKISERLHLPPDQKENLVKSALSERFDLLTRDLNPQPEEPVLEPEPELTTETYRLAPEWYHFAILSLIEMKESHSDPEWFAGRLGIGVLEAHQALLSLVRAGLVERAGRKWKRTGKSVRPTGKHFQNLTKAKQALERESDAAVDFGAETMAIDVSRLEEAREILRGARRQIATLLSSGKKERVYTIVTQLFPVDKK